MVVLKPLGWLLGFPPKWTCRDGGTQRWPRQLLFIASSSALSSGDTTQAGVMHWAKALPSLLT